MNVLSCQRRVSNTSKPTDPTACVSASSLTGGEENTCRAAFQADLCRDAVQSVQRGGHAPAAILASHHAELHGRAVNGSGQLFGLDPRLLFDTAAGFTR